ncbi:MAG: RNase adapter RapZ [Actinomycetales bacterium]|nr:RNase adapter RapZ [Actinomycetales bacterium]
MSESPRPRELLLVTGMSGAGRSTAANALEDLGWFVIDNLPPQLLGPLLELAGRSGDAAARLVAVMDIRGGKLFADVDAALEAVDDQVAVRVLFLDATDDALVRRFENVRRPHPLQGDGTLLQGIAEERRRLLELRERSDEVIDTSELNIHQLAAAVRERFAEPDDERMRLTLLSFGYKYGLPSDADLVADCRFLPNPYWQPELAEGSGLDAPVRDYVLGQPGAQQFLDAYVAALVPVLEGYRRENKRHATIALGCTGGRHRSVAVVEELAGRLGRLPGVSTRVSHRDLGRE